jgi:hypothetical protein
MTQLKELYRSLLSVAYIALDDDDYLVRKMRQGDEPVPCKLGAKALRLSGPTTPPSESYYLVHPLLEKVDSQESPTQTYLRESMGNALQIKLMSLMTSLAVFAASTAEHSRSGSEIKSFLGQVGEVNANALKAITEIMGVSSNPADNKYRLIKLSGKTKAQLDGKVYSHGCIVTFPLYEAICAGETKIGKVSVTKNVKRIMQVLHTYIFESIDTANFYSGEPRIDLAPRFSAVMNSVHSLVLRINDVASQLLGVSSEDITTLVSEVDWWESIQDNESYLKGGLLTQSRQWTSEHANQGTPVAPVRAVERPARALPSTANLSEQVTQIKQAQPQYTAPVQHPVMQAPVQPAALPERGTGLSLAEYMDRKASGRQHAPAGPTMMRDANGQVWQTVAQTPAPNAPPYGAVNAAINPTNGKAYWVDAQGMYLQEAPMHAVPQRPAYQPGYPGMGMMPQGMGQGMPMQAGGWGGMQQPQYQPAPMYPQPAYPQLPHMQQPGMGMMPPGMGYPQGNPMMMHTGMPSVQGFGQAPAAVLGGELPKY